MFLDGTTYRKKGDGNNDWTVLGAGDLADGVAHVSGVRGSRAAELTSFGRHLQGSSSKDGMACNLSEDRIERELWK